MTEDFKYCTASPNFPKEAYMVIAHLKHRLLANNNIQKYPFINLITSLNEITKDINDLSKFANSKGGISVGDVCTIVPVTFDSLYPLREEFWQSPVQHYDPNERINLLLQAISQYEMYKLLVTPHVEDKIETAAAAIPFYLSADDKLIEKFMLTSDWPVDPKGKFAAFYLFEEPRSYNWKTKEISKLLKEEVIKSSN